MSTRDSIKEDAREEMGAMRRLSMMTPQDIDEIISDRAIDCAISDAMAAGVSRIGDEFEVSHETIDAVSELAYDLCMATDAVWAVFSPVYRSTEIED